jgi:hypothetical protein
MNRTAVASELPVILGCTTPQSTVLPDFPSTKFRETFGEGYDGYSSNEICYVRKVQRCSSDHGSVLKKAQSTPVRILCTCSSRDSKLVMTL